MREATLAFLGEQRSARVEAITDRLVDTIERDNPGYRATRLVSREDLRLSCHDNVERILELLRDAVAGDGHGSGRVERDPRYDAARATGRRRAEQGLPLNDVLRSFRIGGRLIWDDVVEQGESRLTAAEVREIGTRLWEVVDTTSAQVAHAYHGHERAMVRADEQQRAELWEGVLGGRARDAGFAREAAMLLDLPVSGELLVVVTASIDLRLAEQRLAPHASTWVRRMSDVVGLVALREERPDGAVAALQALALTASVPLGVSSIVHGLGGGVDDGYHQASFALRAQGEAPGVAAFDDRLPEALLLGSPDVAQRLVERWLGPLLRLPAGESRALLDTLGAWVAGGGSASRTAAAVHCHRNTVVNRLRRVGELTGHDLGDDAVPVELDLALRAWRMGTEL